MVALCFGLFISENADNGRRELNGDVPLIGFAGSPFTVGTYMVEGGSSREFPTIKAIAKESPEVLDHLMNIVAETTIEYLNAQIEAGAQAVQIFDTWGAALEGDDFRRFSMASMQKIIDGLTREKDGRKIPIILFTKGAGPLLADLAETVMRPSAGSRPNGANRGTSCGDSLFLARAGRLPS